MRRPTGRIPHIMNIMKFTAVLCCVMMAMTMMTLPQNCETSMSFDEKKVTSVAATEPRNFNLANEQSFGFFDDIDESSWKHLQVIAAEMVDHRTPEDPLKHLPLDDSPDKPWDKYFDWYQEVSSRVLRYFHLQFLIVMFTSRFHIHFRWQANLTNNDHTHFASRTTNLTSAVLTREESEEMETVMDQSGYATHIVSPFWQRSGKRRIPTAPDVLYTLSDLIVTFSSNWECRRRWALAPANITLLIWEIMKDVLRRNLKMLTTIDGALLSRKNQMEPLNLVVNIMA